MCAHQCLPRAESLADCVHLVHDLPGAARQADENAARSSESALLPSNPTALPGRPFAQVHISPHIPYKTQTSLEAAVAARAVPAGPSRHLNASPSDQAYGMGKHGIRWCYTTTVALQDGLTTPTCIPLPALPSLWTNQCPGAPTQARHGACAEAMSTTTCTCRTPRDRIGGASFFPLSSPHVTEPWGGGSRSARQRHIKGYQPPPAAA